MSLPDEVPPARQEERPGRNWLSVLGIVVLIIVVAAGILELLPSDYYMLLPGQALPVESMISIKGYPTTKTHGHLYMTDVTLYKVNHKLEELYGRVDPNAQLYPAKEFSGGLPETQYLKMNQVLMTNSIQAAEVAALHEARGYQPHFLKAGPEVVYIVPKTPAAAKLQVGDVITAVNGHRVQRAYQVPPLIRKERPGQIVHLSILRHGRKVHLNIRTIASKNGVPDKTGKTPLVGVLVENRLALPVKIAINAGDIGGPSAGLMFSLGIVQRLKPHHDITRGCQIAGTGEIDFAGHVGAIGGAREKIIAAQRTGARYFFVPDVPDNVQGARAAHTGLTIVPVKTLHQALSYLNRLSPCR